MEGEWVEKKKYENIRSIILGVWILNRCFPAPWTQKVHKQMYFPKYRCKTSCCFVHYLIFSSFVLFSLASPILAINLIQGHRSRCRYQRKWPKINWNFYDLHHSNLIGYWSSNFVFITNEIQIGPGQQIE